MSHLWLDPFSGLSGDLWVASFAALGAPEDELRATLRKLPFDDVELRLETVLRCGIEGLRASMVIGGTVDVGGAEDAHFELPAGAKRLSKRRVVKGAHAHGPTWKEVDRLLAERLPGRVGEVARGAFEKLGRAESRVHGTTLEQVHFHEVGLKDSVADVVLAAAGFVALGEPTIHVGPVATGRGRVRMAHGDYPIPTPATMYLLEGFETTPGAAPEGKELCTPTGAALAAQLATFRKAPPRFIPERVAYACGGWDFAETPNVLRLVWGHVPQEASALVQLETNVDDATPQQVAFTQERLLQAGALDVWVTPASFKKGRSGWVLSALVAASRVEELQRMLVAELPTLGVRSWPVQRTEADRRFIETRVQGARVPVKEGIWPHGSTRQPEYEDAARAARESGLPLRAIQDEALGQSVAQRREPQAGEPQGSKPQRRKP